MKLSAKDIDAVVTEIAGEEVLPLVKYLKTKKNISEFKIAAAINAEVNATRNMLYRLYNHNLVTFVRKKDKKKGWYIYYWTFNETQVPTLQGNLKDKRLERLKDRLKREQDNHFFACENKCIRVDFEQAAEFEFKCPECGELLNQEDNSSKIAEIESQIAVLEKEISKV